MNQDDWIDIYSSGTLWKNNQGKSFSKVFEKGGNAVWADFDNNGYSDFFCYDNQRLFWNNHGKRFIARSFPTLSITLGQNVR